MYSFNLRFPNGKSRAMTFSYDDGIPADLRLLELLNKYKVKCTFNINTAHYDNGNEPDNRLKKSQIKEIAENPLCEIACHGHTHPYYNALPMANLTNDIMKNRIISEEITDKIVRGFAYPYGPFNATSEAALKAADIAYARTTKSTKAFGLPEKWLEWHPTCHHKDSLELFNEFMGNVKPWQAPKLMYVWGHTYEFDNDNNWELIEQLFEKATKEEDIWFATNMEIFEYVEAFKELIFSANGNTIYNPTRFDFWALVNANWQPGSGRLIKIPAGEITRV